MGKPVREATPSAVPDAPPEIDAVGDSLAVAGIAADAIKGLVATGIARAI
jgi:hypothetical protein